MKYYQSLISLEQFPSQAKKSWQLLKEEYLKGVNIELKLHYDNDPACKIGIIIKGKNEANLFFRSYGDSEPEEIVARNPNYAFKISKTNPSDSWVIQNIYDDPTQCEHPQFTHGHLESTILAFPSFFLEHGGLEGLISADSFKIMSIKTKMVAGAEYVVVTFESEHDLDRSNRVLGGTLVFDPAKYWILIESDVESKFTVVRKQDTIIRLAKAQTQIEYFDINGIPFPKKLKTTYIHTDRPPGILHVDYVNVCRTKEHDQIFWISHYGFSEPENPT